MQFPLWIPFENEWWTFCVLLISILIFVLGSELILQFGWLSPNSNRRLVHMTIGLLITLSPLIFSTYHQPSTLAFIFIILNIFAFNNKIFKGIHSQGRITYGTIYFPIAYFILTIGFWQYTELIIISLSLLALSDPLAAIIGENTTHGVEFTAWKDKKTVQGTAAFFISAILLIWMITNYLFAYSNTYLLFFTLFTATGATLAEICSHRGSDNLSIPIVSILFMIGFLESFPPSTSYLFDTIIIETLFIQISITILFYIAYRLKALTLDGLLGGLVMGFIIILLGSYYYLLPLAIFFILSSFLSKILRSTSFYRTKGSKRDIIQVYANGGIALFICIIDHFHNEPILIFLFFSSVSAAMADTWATEFGKLSKHKPLSIISLRPIDHGLSGGITRIGTLGSLMGSCIIGFTIWCIMPIPSKITYGIILSGFLAALFDSILGATIQGKYEDQNGMIIENKEPNVILISGYSWVNNDTVNLLNTTMAPILMYIYLLAI